MGFVVREGHYAKLGTSIHNQEVTFTFEGEKEDSCAIVLIDKKSGKQERVEVSDQFCLGSLRSVVIEGIDTAVYDYLYERNGVLQMDPYARRIKGREIWNNEARKEQEYHVMAAFDETNFDWSTDVKPEIPKSEMIMYKLHVRGFSMDHGAPAKIAGTFRAVEDKLDYLKNLGVTTLEFMPVYEFEEIVVPVKEPLPQYINWETEEEDLILPEQEELPTRLNYWGYGSGDYFAVKASYAVNPGKANLEFMELVHELHNRGMECIMEMYFPEGVNHNLILDALRYWVRSFHVDGFHLLGENLPITAIVQDVLLSRTKIFYTNFDGSLLREDKKYKNLFVYREEYQYPARKILNHINGDMVEFVNQQRKQGSCQGFVNFIASNNGFTLADLFMYNDRHNEENGEDNADGNPWNFSNNYGVEGPTRKKFVAASRMRQWRNAVLMLFLAQGVPLLWSGDEMQNSQKGNNNAYCQDNPTGWLNWKNAKNHADCIQFVKDVIAFRKLHPIVANELPFHFNDYQTAGFPDLSYHGENAWITGIELGRMSLGMFYCGAYSNGENKEDVYVGYNFLSAVTSLALPKLPKKKKWYLAIDSSAEVPVCAEPTVMKNQQQILMNPQSICVLVGK